MKYIIIIFVLLNFSVSAFAKCSVSPLYYFQNGELKKPNKETSIISIVVAKPIKVIKQNLTVGGAGVHIVKLEVIENILGELKEPFNYQTPCGIPFTENDKLLIFFLIDKNGLLKSTFVWLNNDEGQKIYNAVKNS